MRIISGEFGGRQLKGLNGQTTRPTTDKVKESIFNIIGPYFDGGICFDLFAGSGGLAIEAISRGMSKAYLFEKDRQAQAVIMKNIDVTKASDHFHLIKGDSQKQLFLINEKADVVFFDPPYHLQQIERDINRLFEHNLLNDGCIIVCETDAKIQLPETIQSARQWKRNVYGTIAVTFYEVIYA